jgi:hypothetical protein
MFYEAEKFTDDGKFVRRVKENVVHWYILPIDIDKDVTILQTIEKFKEFEFVLYTSWNHQQWKEDCEPPCDRFRMFILLDKPIHTDDFYPRTDSLKNFIGVMDQCSLSRSRGFYEPACKQNMYSESLFYHNKGKALNIWDFEPIKKEQDWDESTLDNDELDDELRQAILEGLQQIGNVDYEGVDSWWKIGSAMVDGGFSEYEFDMVSRSLRSHRPYDSGAQWSSSKQTPINWKYLINVLNRRLGSGWRQKNNVNKTTYSEDDREIASLYKQLKQLKQKSKKA